MNKPSEQTITPEVVQYIAGLARIHLRDDELERFTSQLGNILHYITKLEKADVSQIEPTSHVLALQNVFRPDVVKTSLTQGEALGIAVTAENNSFKVPQVIE